MLIDMMLFLFWDRQIFVDLDVASLPQFSPDSAPILQKISPPPNLTGSSLPYSPSMCLAAAAATYTTGTNSISCSLLKRYTNNSYFEKTVRLWMERNSCVD